MKIDEDLSQISAVKDSVITIGVFDGVHVGHAHLIRSVIQEATLKGFLSCVVTFKNHPKTILVPEFRANYILDFEDRVTRLKELGVDLVVPITFDLDLANLPAKQFLSRISRHLSMKTLIVGPDFAMGHNRDGNLTTLPIISRELGFTFEVVDLLKKNDNAVNSTVIRNHIMIGDIEPVSQMLGRNFSIAGTIVHGLKRGADLGFPTANIEIDNGCIVPGDGIYATWAQLGSDRYMAATSIGTRPTFGEGGRTIEAHILDFSDNIYSKPIKMEFVKRLRGEEKYETVEGLIEQIAKDVQNTRAILTEQ